MPETRRKTRGGALALALMLAAPLALAQADEPEGEKEKEVHVVKIRKECKSQDCGDEHRIVRRVKIGDAEGDGKKVVWIGSGDAEGHVVLAGPHGKGGFLGVGLTELTPELRSHFGVPADAGVMVSKVVSGSPAERAGLRVGDIIAAVDGDRVSGPGSLAGAIRKHGDGESVTLEVWRDGSLQNLSATLEEREGIGAHHMRTMVFDCDDEDGPCGHQFAFGENFDFEFDPDFDCGDGEDCKVEVECHDGGCDCQINGQAADCATIPGFRGGKE